MNALNKRLVHRSFASAAEVYDQNAELQRQVGRELLKRFEPLQASGVDLGCGTGFLTRELVAQCPDQPWLAVDLAMPMLQLSRDKLGNDAGIQYLCADAEALPFKDISVPQMFSNLALQWCENLPVLFEGGRRVLEPGGQLVFSTFGPETLKELKLAWAAVDQFTHVNEFKTASDIKASLIAAGFEQVVLETEIYRLHYGSVIELMRELKGLGAHNIHQNRNRQLTTASQLQVMINAYEAQMSDLNILASYEVFYVRAVR